MRLPNLLKGEKIILWSQSSLCMRDSWQEGYVFLTNRRLIFNQVTKLTYETSLNDIIKLSIEKRPWFFGVRVRQLCIDFRSEKGQEKIYLALAKPKKWSYKNLRRFNQFNNDNNRNFNSSGKCWLELYFRWYYFNECYRCCQCLCCKCNK